MARNMYGATSADFTLTSGGRVVPGATLTIWSARTGGTQITDLLDKDSVATTTVTSDADGSIVYYGPNNDKTVHWADSGVGSRIAIRPVDITGDPPVLSIGTVGTGAAAASLTGTSEAPVLNLTLPTAGANGVDTAAIQSKAVTAAKIADDTITAAQIAANAVGSSELADNAVDTNAIADSAVTSAKIADGTIVSADVAASTFAAFGTVGNLLTPNQAQPTTTGALILNSCAEGAAGVYTASGSGAAFGYVPGPPFIAVTAGDTYTALATLATVGRTANVRVEWLNSGGSIVSFVSGSTVAAGTTAVSSVSAVAPAGAVAARFYPFITGSGSAGNTVTVTNATFHKGAAGTFALPGVPVVGGSHIATNGAVHLSGTGSPEGVVTAAPGSTWLQTDSTTDVKGWIRWVKASGTGSTGWVAGPEADTGWRNVSADVGADFSVSDKILIRRQGSRVTVQLRNVVRVTNSGNRFTPSTVYTLPTGFRHTSYVDFGACYVQTLLGCFSTGGDLNLLAVRSTGTWAANDALWGEGDFLTDDTWPTSLPGVAV